MPAPNALTAPLASPSKKFHGNSALQTYPFSGWKSTQMPNVSSEMSSSTRKNPRNFAVSSMWKNANMTIAATVPNSNTQTGMSTPNQSLIVLLAK